MSQDHIDDEELFAFLDGELSPERHAIVAEAMARDDALLDRVARLTALSDTLQSAYPLPQQDTLPERFADSLRAFEIEKSTSEPLPNIVSFPGRATTKTGLGPKFVASWLPYGAAAAAVLLLGVGLSFGWRHDPSPLSLKDGQLVASTDLGARLDTTPSLTTVALSKTQSVTPRLTVQAAQGRLCRQFDVVENGQSTQAIACRGPKRWTMEAVVHSGQAPLTGETYATAAGPDEALVSTLSRIGAGQSLDATTERAALANLKNQNSN